MKFPLVVIRDEYNGAELHVNIDNILYIKPKYDGGYVIVFVGGSNELTIDYKQYDKLKKAFEQAAASKE